MSTSSQDLVAAFLAKGGKVRTVTQGATAGLTHRDWYNANRGIVTNSNAHVVKGGDNFLIEQRITRGGVVYNGLGEVIGRDPEFDEALWTARHSGDMER